MNRKKIILDTDIGDDIDDLFALNLLANSPEVELLGVTTVFRNAEKRAKMAAYALKEINRGNIPVYAGADQPLICVPETIVAEEILKKEKRDEKGKYLIPQYAEYMNSAEYRSDNAVEFIVEQARKYGKELHLVLIGAFTNAALAIRTYPEVMKTIAEITVMGGCYNQNYPEWNILCDPEAARIVFSFGVPVKAVGIDVTSKCKLTKKFRQELKEKNVRGCRLLTEMTEKWFSHYLVETPVMHDPLAVSTLISDEFVKFKEEKIKVVLEGENRGETIIAEDGNPVQVAIDVDCEKFFSFFERRIFI
jgi:purine nucleosidase/pyrimidine-specific ribonucleoside hydrolase